VVNASTIEKEAMINVGGRCGWLGQLQKVLGWDCDAECKERKRDS